MKDRGVSSERDHEHEGYKPECLCCKTKARRSKITSWVILIATGLRGAVGLQELISFVNNQL